MGKYKDKLKELLDNYMSAGELFELLIQLLMAVCAIPFVLCIGTMLIFCFGFILAVFAICICIIVMGYVLWSLISKMFKTGAA